eukprot:m.530107 g.530107  ORF g.530107 m.530107 type:complete len:778 (+) comp22025_c0_seq5:106-2439(+)
MSNQGSMQQSRSAVGSMSLNLDAATEADPLIPRVPSVVRMGARTGVRGRVEIPEFIACISLIVSLSMVVAWGLHGPGSNGTVTRLVYMLTPPSLAMLLSVVAIILQTIARCNGTSVPCGMMPSIFVLFAGAWSVLILVAFSRNASWLYAHTDAFTTAIYAVDAVAVFLAVIFATLREHKRILWHAFAKMHPDTVPPSTWCTLAYCEFGSTALNGTAAVFKHVSTNENVCFVGNTTNVGINLSKLPPSDYGMRQYYLATGDRIDYDACVRTRRANILACKYLMSTILDPKTGDIYVSICPDAANIPIFIGYAVPGRYDPGLRWRGGTGQTDASGRIVVPGSITTLSPSRRKSLASPSARDGNVSGDASGLVNPNVGVASTSAVSQDSHVLHSDNLTICMDGSPILRRVATSLIKQGKAIKVFDRAMLARCIHDEIHAGRNPRCTLAHASRVIVAVGASDHDACRDSHGPVGVQVTLHDAAQLLRDAPPATCPRDIGSAITTPQDNTATSIPTVPAVNQQQTAEVEKLRGRISTFRKEIKALQARVAVEEANTAHVLETSKASDAQHLDAIAHTILRTEEIQAKSSAKVKRLKGLNSTLKAEIANLKQMLQDHNIDLTSQTRAISAEDSPTGAAESTSKHARFSETVMVELVQSEEEDTIRFSSEDEASVAPFAESNASTAVPTPVGKKRKKKKPPPVVQRKRSNSTPEHPGVRLPLPTGRDSPSILDAKTMIHVKRETPSPAGSPSLSQRRKILNHVQAVSAGKSAGNFKPITSPTNG